jgi:anti-sigma-K factor RskA
METSRLEGEEASSSLSTQQSVKVPLMLASSSSSTNASKEKPLLLNSSMKKFQDRSSHKLSRSSQFSRANSNGFWWEILAAFSSVVVVVALMAILYAYNNRPPPLWAYGITVSISIQLGFFLL